MPILGTIASSRLVAAADPGAVIPINSFVVPSAGSSTLTFSSIPNTYKHLQLRGVVLSSTTPRMNIRFNSDSGSNYAVYVLEGNGTSGFRQGETGITSAYCFINGFYSANQPQPFVIDIPFYTSAVGFKTFRALTGGHNNSGGNVALSGGLWRNSADAISSITISASTGSFSQHSVFSLYGIKG